MRFGSFKRGFGSIPICLEQIQAIFQNEQLVRKIMALNKVILESETGAANTTTGEAPARPKVVEIK